MKDQLRRLVRRRARLRCEFCGLPEADSPVTPHHVEHIIARKHHGPTRSSNLALSCLHCNRHKGPNLSGIDPQTRLLTRLFHPRRHSWSYHFRWEGARLRGRTAIGRTTIRVLRINAPLRVVLREELITAGLFGQPIP